jgi:2-polyprenyl-3-methyl-5-hydroxy-6-metoxy-1,4-benzoquinol methylase
MLEGIIGERVRMAPIRSRPQLECTICGCPGKLLHHRLADVLFDSQGEWDLSQCSNASCGLTWLNPMPLEEDISEAYRNYYTHGDLNRARSAASRLLFSVLGLEKARRRAELYYLDESSPGSVLEVGFGDGSRLKQLASLGWSVEGQEVDPIAVHKLRDQGFKVHEGRLQDLALPEGKYDAVVANHVIEHVHSPLEVMNDCRRLTKPGGLVIMLTPNSKSYGHRVFGRHWLGLDPPRHLHLFSLPSLGLLAANAGFTDYRVFTNPALSAIPFQASIAMSRQGRFRFGQKASLVDQLSVAGHITASRFLQLLNSRWGEEIVIIAVA